MAQITGSALTIYHSQVLKKSAENSWLFLYGRSKTIDFRMPSTFFWEGVDVPVKATEDSPNCGTVHPRQQPGTLPMLHLPQVFHSTTEVLSRFSAPLHRLLVIVGLTVSGCGYQGLQFSCLINGILSALSEAWFCRHMGLKGEIRLGFDRSNEASLEYLGTLPSIKAAERGIAKPPDKILAATILHDNRSTD